MGDCTFAESGRGRAAAAAVAPVVHEVRIEGLRGDVPLHNGQVRPFDGVCLKLRDQRVAGRRPASKDEQAARFSIDAVDGKDRADRFRRDVLAAGDQFGQQVVESRLERLLLDRPAPLGPVPQRDHAGRLVDHDHICVEVDQSDVRDRRRRLMSAAGHFDEFPLLQAAGLVETEHVIDKHAAGGEQFSQGRPRLAGQPVAQSGEDGPTGLRRLDDEALAFGVHVQRGPFSRRRTCRRPPVPGSIRSRSPSR